MRLGYFTRQPGVIEKLKSQGLEPMPLSPAEFDALIEKEIVTIRARAATASGGGSPASRLFRQAHGRNKKTPALSRARGFGKW